MNAYCLDTLYVGEDFKVVSIEDFGAVYESADATIDIKSVQKLGNEVFLPLKEFGISHPPSENVYWVGLIIKNSSNYPIDLILENTHHTIDSVQFFSQKIDTLIRSNLTGDRVKFNSRSPSHRNYLFPIHLKENESQHVYYYLNKKGGALVINAHLYERTYFNQRDSYAQFYNLLYIGFLVCVCFLTFATALIFRQNIISFYALYCLFGTGLILSMSGFGFQYLWGNYPTLNSYVAYFFTLGMLVSFIALTRHFILTAELLPRLNKFLILLEILTVFILLPVNFLHRHISNRWMIYFTYFGQLIQLITLVSIITVSILAFLKTKNKIHLIYLFSFLFYIVGIVLFVISRFTTWLEISGWIGYSIYFFWLIDILILMLLILLRIRETYQENTQLQQQLTTSKLSAANLLLEGQLEERKRLSQELHDGISIQMALLKMRLNDAFKAKGKESNAIISQVENISQDIRAFTHAISPLNLEEETLGDAIEDLVFKIENQTSLVVKISMKAFEGESLKSNQKRTLYQILQELFNNTIKHAEASLVKIDLSSTTQKVALNYQDNGKGFDANTVFTGIGLKNMQARIDLLNGKFTIQSTPKGSRFMFEFDL